MIWIYQAGYDTGSRTEDRSTEHELGRMLLQKGLRENYKMEPDKKEMPVIEKGEHGKPYFRDYPHIHYNISHTKGMVVCGLGDVPLGVDIELIRPFKQNIVRKVMAKEEIEQLAALPFEEQKERFFRFWTLKESYVKAVGCGITLPLSEIKFSLKRDGAIDCGVCGYGFWQKKIGTDYILSVCAAGEMEVSLSE